MATRADVRRIADANRRISRLAQMELRGLWATLNLADPMEVREALEDLLPDLVTVYGELAATVAADWYDEMREQAEARGSFTAILAAPFAAEAVRANARWAIGPLFQAQPEPDRALSLLELEMDRMSLQPGRDTRTGSAARDPAKPRFARVPTSAQPCAFCTMLASRGAVYESEASAGGGLNSYHAACGCEPTPVFDGQGLPEGYDPEALYGIYEAAAIEAGPGAPAKQVLSQMRQLTGTH